MPARIHRNNDRGGRVLVYANKGVPLRQEHRLKGASAAGIALLAGAGCVVLVCIQLLNRACLPLLLALPNNVLTLC